MRGNGIPNGTGNPIENGNWREWETISVGMGITCMHSHGNLFPKVLCCDELSKLLVLYLPDVNAYFAELITLSVPSA